MDELQDAIEDAQYVNAIACVDDGPRPMIAWEFPNEEQLVEWKANKNGELSKLISEGRRTRRRSSYSRLNVDKGSRAARSSSVVGNLSSNSVFKGGEESKSASSDPKSKPTMQTAAATDNPKDGEEEKEDQEEPSLHKKAKPSENGATESVPPAGGAVVAVETTTPGSTRKIDEDKAGKTSAPGGAEDRSSSSKLVGVILKATPLESYEYICAQPLGFFLFAQYVKDVQKDYLRMNFVEDAVLYRRVRGSHHREHRAKEIALTYLVDKGQPGNEAEDVYDGSRMSAISTTLHDNASPDIEGDAEGDNNTATSTPNSPSSTMNLSKKSKSKRYATKSSHASDDLSILNMDKELVIQEPPNDPDMNNIPQKKDIVEFDLARLEEVSLRKMGQSDSDLSKFLAENLDLRANSRSLIKVKMDGPCLRRALKRCGIPYTNPNKKSTVSAQHDKKNNSQLDAEAASEATTEAKTETNESESLEQKETAPVKPKGEEAAGGDGGNVVDANSSTRNNSLAESTATALPANEGAAIADELEELRVSGDRDLFDELELIVMEGLQQEYWSGFLTSKEYSKLLNFWYYRDRKVVEDDFFLMRVLGRGGFGLVHACKKGTSGKLFAMKVMNKKRIKLKKSEQLTVNERMALAAVDSPFVVKLSYAFQSKDDIFLVLDLMTGGDLGFHLHQKGKFSKRECLYFSARIMLGLQAIHDRRFVYRDLKPENVLVGDDGRVKLSDLGLATKVTPTLHGAAGTRGYWAPEMLRRDAKGRRKAYGHTVDWFSFGCCLYEFISGFNPFRSQDALRFGNNEGMDSKEKALDCATMKMEPSFDPARFDHDAADLCLKLLDKNEKTRLGLKGCQEIMAHTYYRDMNWEAIISDRMKPPFLPRKDVNAASQSEIGTFAEDRTYHETQLEAEDEQIYKYWDWTNPSGFDAEVIEFLIHERRTGKPLVPSDPMTPCCCTLL